MYINYNNSDYNKFTTSLLKTCINDEKNENVVFSPFSILMMLAITAEATSGETKKEITQVLGSDLSDNELRDLYSNTLAIVTRSNAFSSANAVCINQVFSNTIDLKYADQIKRYYGGEVFSSENMASEINRWVRKKTNGLIDSVADRSIEKAMVCFMNATAFEEKWTKHYTRNDIKYRKFFNFDGTSPEKAMLSITENEYIDTEFFTGFVKPYKNNDFSFMALLPKKEGNEGLMNAIRDLDISEVFKRREDIKVNVFLPEFKYSNEYDLNSFCRIMGIKNLFSDNADFSLISGAPLKAESLIHKAMIEVNREGTKAAAYTGVCVCAGGISSIFCVDLYRPFVYAIMHNKTELPVFVGVLNKLI